MGALYDFLFESLAQYNGYIDPTTNFKLTFKTIRWFNNQPTHLEVTYKISNPLEQNDNQKSSIKLFSNATPAEYVTFVRELVLTFPNLRFEANV